MLSIGLFSDVFKFFFKYLILIACFTALCDDIKHNLSLKRKGKNGNEAHSLYDLTLGSDKSSNFSCSETGTYDVIRAEKRQNQMLKFQYDEEDAGVKRTKWTNETSYFLIKELLMTERTYKKDLEILNHSLREAFSQQDIENFQLLFELLDLLEQHHNSFLKDLEQRIISFESRGVGDTRIGDIVLRHLSILPTYDEYLQAHMDILHDINDLCNVDDRFDNLYKEFEQQPFCYLPVTELLLKPLYRVLHYELIISRLCEVYPQTNVDFIDCQAVYHILTRTTKSIRENLYNSTSFVQMYELQRNIIGINKIMQENRHFIRHGYLLKHSKRGLQQRMFILLTDILLYGIKIPSEDSFRVLGHVPVRSLLTENGEYNAFVIYGGKTSITVSAATTAEKTLWLSELAKASAEIRNSVPDSIPMTLLKNRTASEESIETCSMLTELQKAGGQTLAQQKISQSRSNTALHVCWHRGATIGIGDYLIAAENQMSGYLLRKFKNSSGWQKLWVVFTSFCLFFYKSYQDDAALASLPLLGYSVGPPSHQDAVQKEFVFKLTFKNHIYFFRAESMQSYERWLEVLQSTTNSQDFKHITAK